MNLRMHSCSPKTRGSNNTDAIINSTMIANKAHCMIRVYLSELRRMFQVPGDPPPSIGAKVWCSGSPDSLGSTDMNTDSDHKYRHGTWHLLKNKDTDTEK